MAYFKKFSFYMQMLGLKSIKRSLNLERKIVNFRLKPMRSTACVLLQKSKFKIL
ncbi:hypothetical protein UNSWCS_1001 [Campylobacter concisus UNSWCS]|uniref:Uncharacterized protein n=1 Tax=Campylobacter concisus UNSWCS TaxID=1242968 RepID=U2EZJ0_9BACT|nr:hypothetical protein UNSWCS_1001 [Campylobacter concisus UNSWCS]